MVGTQLAPGLTDGEFARLERDHGVVFADDHRAFLAGGLSVGVGWPDWRHGGRTLARALRLPVEGILHAVEWSTFWDASWGLRPPQMRHALRSAAYHLARVPALLPVRGHCYLPAGGLVGHPVLSVYQADVAVAGDDLATYLDGLAGADVPAPTARPTVAFWSDLVR